MIGFKHQPGWSPNGPISASACARLYRSIARRDHRQIAYGTVTKFVTLARLPIWIDLGECHPRIRHCRYRRRYLRIVPKNGAICSSMIDPPRGFLVTSLALASGAHASSEPRRMRATISIKPTSEGVLACRDFAESFAGSTMSRRSVLSWTRTCRKAQDFLCCCCCCNFNKSSSFFNCGISSATRTESSFRRCRDALEQPRWFRPKLSQTSYR